MSNIPIDDVMAGRVNLDEVADPSRRSAPAVTPGEILLEEFMRPLGLSARFLAAALGVPANRVTAILNGHRAITADTALRLARYFGTSPQLWMNLQANFDLNVATRTAGPEIERLVRPRAA